MKLLFLYFLALVCSLTLIALIFTGGYVICMSERGSHAVSLSVILTFTSILLFIVPALWMVCGRYLITISKKDE